MIASTKTLVVALAIFGFASITSRHIWGYCQAQRSTTGDPYEAARQRAIKRGLAIKNRNAKETTAHNAKVDDYARFRELTKQKKYTEANEEWQRVTKLINERYAASKKAGQQKQAPQPSVVMHRSDTEHKTN